jgi:hypothetical protein
LPNHQIASSSTTRTPSECENEITLNLKNYLNKNLTAWLEKNSFSAEDDDPASLSLIINVGRNINGTISATVECPLDSCSSVINLTHQGTRWVTSNFHRHIEKVHILKGVKEMKEKKNQMSIKSMFHLQNPFRNKSKEITQKASNKNQEPNEGTAAPVVHLGSPSRSNSSSQSIARQRESLQPDGRIERSPSHSRSPSPVTERKKLRPSNPIIDSEIEDEEPHF